MISRSSDLHAAPSPCGPSSSGGGSARTWTVGDLLTWTEEHFTKLGIATARLDAELLLARAMGVSRLELYTGYGKVVESSERAAFRGLVERRRRFEPVAYLLGEKEFYSLVFEVDAAVFIPRPETELLVDRVLEEIPESADTAVLELGTGSGNIAVAIAVNRRRARLTTVDLSPEALEVARRNARRHGVEDQVRFVQGNLFEPLTLTPDAAPEPTRMTVVDVVVSNPPYVSRLEYRDLMPDVRDHEPRMALVDAREGSGLGFYREIVARAKPYLKPGGLLVLEVGATQAGPVRELLVSAGWDDLQTTTDYAGLERVVTARSPNA